MKNFRHVLKCSIIVVSLVLSMFLTSCMRSNGLTLNNENVTLSVGESTTLTANIDDKDMVWSSSNESVATVTQGKVEAVGEGETTITAMLKNGEKATCDVKVESISVDSVQIDSKNISVKKGETVSLSAEIYPSSASSATLTWKSDNPDIATVDDNGLVTGNKAGTTVVRCTASNGKSDSATVKVTGKKKKNTSNNTTTIINHYYNPDDGEYTDSISDATLYCRASDYATLRSYASRKAKSLAKIKSRESVQCVDVYDEEFYEVIYQGKRGYVLRDYFSSDPDAPLNHGNN